MFIDFRHKLLAKYLRVKTVVPLSITTFLFMFGWAVLGPFYSIHVNSILQDTFLVGLFFSMWGIVRLFSDTFVGALTDYFENKQLISLSLIGYTIIGLGYYYTTDKTLFFLLRIVHALVGSVLWVSIWAYLHKSINRKYREENISINVIFRTLPYLIAPLIGASIVTIFDTKTLFLVVSAFSFLGFLYWRIKGQNVRIKSEISIKETLKEELKMFKKKRKQLKLLSYLFIPVFAISGAYATFLPVYLYGIGFSVEQIAILSIIEIIPILFLFKIGRMADLKGRKKVLQISFFLSSASFFLVYLSRTFFHYALSMFFMGISASAITPTINSLVGDYSKKGEEGKMAGITETLKDVGTIIGPLLGGFLLELFSYKALLLMISALTLLLQIPSRKVKN